MDGIGLLQPTSALRGLLEREPPRPHARAQPSTSQTVRAGADGYEAKAKQGSPAGIDSAVRGIHETQHSASPGEAADDATSDSGYRVQEWVLGKRPLTSALLLALIQQMGGAERPSGKGVYIDLWA